VSNWNGLIAVWLLPRIDKPAERKLQSEVNCIATLLTAFRAAIAPTHTDLVSLSQPCAEFLWSQKEVFGVGKNDRAFDSRINRLGGDKREVGQEPKRCESSRSYGVFLPESCKGLEVDAASQ